MAETNSQRVLDEILRQAIKMSRSKLANMQIINKKKNCLEIVTHHGFSQEFLEHFSKVTAEDGSICGRAMMTGKTVFIHDITKDKLFTPHLSIALKAGFRAVQSTPLMTTSGNLIGIISTHFTLPHRLTKEELINFEAFCRNAADKIEAFILN
ncbi:MAG TPA: GAF domain-containing protein [Ignavibacteria bacterium]